MKALKYLRRTACLTIETATVRNGLGRIRVNDWEGSVIWSTENGWEHISVSPFNLKITPSWADLCEIKNVFFEEEELAIQFFPRKSQYINIMENCLHLWRPTDPKVLKILEDSGQQV